MDALQQIATEMGATLWRFNADICELEMVGVSQTPPSGSEGYVECNCNYNNNSICHVTKMYKFRFLITYHYPVSIFSCYSYSVDVKVEQQSLVDLIQC